jgi:hypothetical protein
MASVASAFNLLDGLAGIAEEVWPRVQLLNQPQFFILMYGMFSSCRYHVCVSFSLSSWS